VARLLQRWRAETAFESSTADLIQHPAYQEIIALGTPALPALWRDLEQSHDGHLAKALAVITGAQPVPPEERGQIRRTAERWLAWAKENGQRW
jgi:hypothetical protein